MVEFLRKSESRGDKNAGVNSRHQIYQFALILYGVWVRGDRGRYPCAALL